METADTIYVIKLIGGISKFQMYHFADSTHYAVRSLRFETVYSAKKAAYHFKTKEPYRFSDHDCVRHTSKPLMPIVLLHPSSLMISKSADGQHDALPHARNIRRPNDILYNGDHTGEGYLYTWKRLQQRLI